MLTQERLKELLDYDSLTGIFIWKKARNNNLVGIIAGAKRPDGYLRIRIDYKFYYAHRLAWLYVYGEWPKNCIDHKDMVHDNNRISNLRDVTNSVNMQNQRAARKDNLHGFLGVKRNGNGFAAHIQLNGKQKNLGTRKTPEEAHELYVIEKRKIHAGCTI